MIEALNEFLAQLVGYLWSLPLVCFLLGTGLFFSFFLGGIQLRGFFHAIQVVRGKYDNPDDPGEISHFKALCAALSATVGLGNIAGVAVAIKVGGPGATVWMILAGLVGMASKYTECTLGVMYRRVDEEGVVHGGPMHYISQGLKGRYSFLSDQVVNFLAAMFAVCCIIASLGAANMFQANQVAESLQNSFGVEPLHTGIVLALAVAIVIIGGIKRIGNVAGVLVPVMGLLYISGCLAIILLNIAELPRIISEIFSAAFTGTAAAGGFAGAAFRQVLVQGVRRAAFSSEAGMGSAAIAHSAAKTDEPVREGTVALLEPFIDTVVICTMTALVINITGVWTGDETGVKLTQAALDKSIPGLGTWFIPVAVALFAYSSMISWSYYGERSVDYLVGEKGIIVYKVIFCLFAICGALWSIDPILNFSDSALALMIIPNLFAMLLLAGVVRQATTEYFEKLESGKMPENEEEG